MSLHIGVISKQNTGNLSPAIQLGATAFWGIETHFAAKSDWIKGFQKVAQRYKIDAQKKVTIPEGNDSNIPYLYKQLKSQLSNEKEVVFNLTGGQKPQQLALWQIFEERSKNPSYRDKAVYVSFERGIGFIQEYVYANNELSHRSFECDVPYTIKDLIELFNLEVELETYHPCYNSGNILLPPSKSLDLLDDREFRNYIRLLGEHHPDNAENHPISVKDEVKDYFNLFKENIIQTTHKVLVKRLDFVTHTDVSNADFRELKSVVERVKSTVTTDALSRSIIKKIHRFFNDVRYELFDAPVHSLEKDGMLTQLLREATIELDLNTFYKISKNKKPSFYFEEKLTERFIEQIKENPFTRISEVASNLKIRSSDSNISTAEHDIIIATRFGTLLSIDAKIFSISAKDLDARLLNMTLAGGAYSTFHIAFPYYAEDFVELEMNASITDTLKRLYNTRKPFYVLGNKNNSPTSEIKLHNSTYSLKNFNYILQDLNLVKSKNAST